MTSRNPGGGAGAAPHYIIEDIKARVDLVELINEDTPLRLNGQEYVGWHQAHDSRSKTSLRVHPAKQLYICHNCGEGGDAFSWVMRNRGLSFRDALRYLASRAGVPVPDMSEADRARHQRAYEDHVALAPVLAAAAEFYHAQLLPRHFEEAAARWGLTSETIRRFRIGYAPAWGKALLQHLSRDRGFDPALLEKTGLFWKNPDGSLSDFFRGRLMIPYWSGGQVVYFIGRWSQGCRDDPEKAKYKKQLTQNDAHPWVSPAVDNSRFLGEDSVEAGRELLIAEGAGDCLAALQAGFACITPNTTRFREADRPRMLRLARLAGTVYICNDQEDSLAGERGALDTAEFLESHGVPAKVVILPRPEGSPKMDLAEYLRGRGDAARESLRELLGKGMSCWEVKLLRAAVPSNPMDAVKAARDFAVNALAGCDDLEARRLIAGPLRQKFGLDAAEVAQIVRSRQEQRRREAPTAPPENHKLPAAYGEWEAMLARTGVYRVVWPGYLCYTKETPDGPVPVRVANFIPRTLAEVTRDDGVEQTKTMKIDGILAGGVPLPPVTVSAKDFNSMNWITQCWGWRPALEPGRGAADRVRHAINLLAGEAQYQTVYTYLGWRRERDRWIYLHGNGAVGADDVRVDLDDELARYALPDAADPEAVRLSLDLLDVAPRSVTVPLLALVYLAPLCEPLRRAGCEPAFVFWLYGRSGNLKSTLAALFLCHYGRFDGKSLPCSFKDSTNALEKTGFLAKDALLVVDDYHPVGERGEAQKMRAKAQALLRGYGDRKGRGRMKADTSLRRAYAPRGMCLVTGEDLPDAGESTSARFLKVDLVRGTVDRDLLSRCQFDAGRLPGAMRSYIEWLAPQLDALPDALGQGFRTLRGSIDVGEGHARLADEVAWLLIGYRACLDHAVSVGAVDEAERVRMMREAREIISGLAADQGRIISQESPTARFVSLLRDTLVSGRGHVVDLSTLSPIDDADDKGKSPGFLGWRDARYYYLLPEVTYQTVAEMAQRQGGNFPVTAQTLWKRLYEDGITTPGGSGSEWRPTRQKKIGAKNQRLLWVKVSALWADADMEDGD